MVNDSADLCTRILHGDTEAEAELIQRFLPRVRTIVAMRSSDRDAVDDLGQSVMLAALCALREEMPRDPEMLPSFIFGIARNLVNSHFRQVGRMRAGDLSAAESIPNAAAQSREREMIEDARREIDKLDPADREVLNLSLNEGMEPAEIASRLRIPASTVRQRKARAIRRLVERLSRGRGPAPL